MNDIVQGWFNLYIQVDTPACTTAPRRPLCGSGVLRNSKRQAQHGAAITRWFHKYIFCCRRNVFVVPDAQILGTLYCSLCREPLGTFEANQCAEQV